MAKKIRVTQIRNGKRVTFLTPDKGKPGKTPKSKQWYEPGVETGWGKGMPQGERRGLVLKAHKGDELASARSMQALANVTTDRETKREARADALHFFREHNAKSQKTAAELEKDWVRTGSPKTFRAMIRQRKKEQREGRSITSRSKRITPRTPKLRR